MIIRHLAMGENILELERSLPKGRDPREFRNEENSSSRNRTPRHDKNSNHHRRRPRRGGRRPEIKPDFNDQD